MYCYLLIYVIVMKYKKPIPKSILKILLINALREKKCKIIFLIFWTRIRDQREGNKLHGECFTSSLAGCSLHK